MLGEFQISKKLMEKQYIYVYASFSFCDSRMFDENIHNHPCSWAY